MTDHTPISKKTKVVLKGILIILALIFLRIWQLSILEKEDYQKLSKKPQRRRLIEHPERGTILDRFGTPLAINRISYNASIYYGNISEIPRIEWQKDEKGVRKKVYARKRYIEELAKLLAKELRLDPIYVEDLIHSKASLLPHVPFVIKKNISEKEYYRLRMLERDYPGLHAEITSVRHYPQGKVACDILGYMGAIDQNKYLKIAREIKLLKNYFQDLESGSPSPLPPHIATTKNAAIRLKELKERAYTIHDSIGKSGVEARFEEELRGFSGNKTFEVDVKGSFLRKLPDSKNPISGKTLTLSISSELQSYAEALLAEDEKTRDGRSKTYDRVQKKKVPQKQPWIKGGAIVALDPKTGEVLALASYPRFDPNDFLGSGEKANDHIHEWYETETHIAKIWNGEKDLTRDRFENGAYYEERKGLAWNVFIDEILKEGTPLYDAAKSLSTIKKMIELQEDIAFLLYYSEQKSASLLFDDLFPNAIRADKKREPYFGTNFEYAREKARILEKWSPLFAKIKHNADKVFLIDLARLAIFSPAFSDELIQEVGNMKIEKYISLSKEMHALQKRAYKMTKSLFHDIHFSQWRKEHMKEYLREKRAEEKRKKTYARPYIDYLDKKEKKLFQDFWKRNRLHILTCYIKGEDAKFENSEELESYYPYFILKSNEDKNRSDTINLISFAKNLKASSLHAFLKTMRSFEELDRPLYYQSHRLRAAKGHQLEKHLAASFYPLTGFGYGRSYAYRQSTPLGSIFKLMTSYAALTKRVKSLAHNPSMEELSPFEMIDEIRWESSVGKNGGVVVGYTLDKKPYPRYYRGGRLPRSAGARFGRLDLSAAIEQSSNPYFSLLAGDYLDSPDDLLEAARLFGLGKKTGISLSGEIAGNLPKDLKKNKTGLYSFAIGQHSLIATPLQASLMMATFANGGSLLKPRIIKNIRGAELPRPFHKENELYQEELTRLGFSFPIFWTDFVAEKEEAPEMVHNIFLTKEMREFFLNAMRRVVSGKRGNARPEIIKGLLQDRKLLNEYKSMGDDYLGKTSTAEILYNPYINPSSKAEIVKHIWFGGISFRKKETREETWKDPELIVIVFLRFGDAGKECVPLAFKMMKKYREILEKQH